MNRASGAAIQAASGRTSSKLVAELTVAAGAGVAPASQATTAIPHTFLRCIAECEYPLERSRERIKLD